jgi:hypothetical protein
MEIARSEGIAVPNTAAVGNFDELEKSIDKIGFPAVFKADGTAAGIGVRIAHTRLEAEHAFKELSSPPGSLRVLKRAAVDRDLTLLLPFVRRKRSLVNAQSFISGRDATASIACWKGKVLESITFEVLRSPKPNGPASVVGIIDNPQISKAAAKLVHRLHLSGLFGLDFKIDEFNVPYLLEMNPRATQSSHLNLGKGRDPAAGFVAAMSGQELLETEVATGSSVIVLFPNEWQDNPRSEFLRIGYHDVPWSEPELVRACTKKPSRLKNWCSSDGRAEIQSKIGWPGSTGAASSSQSDCRKGAPRQSPAILAESDVPPFVLPSTEGNNLGRAAEGPAHLPV